VPGLRFRFTGHVPKEELIGSYYRSDTYISHSDTHKGVINKLYHWVRQLMLRRKAKLIHHWSPGHRLLDIGCGTGHFLHLMQRQGYQVKGIEIDAETRERASATFGLEVSSPDQMTFTETSASAYDTITLWHVLEHVQDPRTYLSWINHALQPDGVLVLALPNCSSKDAQHYSSHWAAYDVPRHLWHFRPVDIQRLAEEAGFTLQQIRRMPFDAYYNALMSARYARKPMAFLNGLFFGFLSNWHSLRHPELSSSITYLFKKTTSQASEKAPSANVHSTGFRSLSAKLLCLTD
jgi:2-polyprenyl-3-methyl-5-hydroxy-6-metoxy-1,4-benzoquinol methylase